MAEFRITLRAARDLEEIDAYLEEHAGVSVAGKVLNALFDAFEDLVSLPAIGHRRNDVRQAKMLFHNVFRYTIAFRREPRVVILRVAHQSQNLAWRLSRE